MNKVEIYSKNYCPFCHRAKTLLDAKGIDYQEYEISTDQLTQQEMRKRTSRTSVPQIFINNHHVGGSDDLADAERSGLLDELLDLNSSTKAQTN